MTAYSIFCIFVLVPLCCATVIRNGMKLAALPVPGTIYRNGSILVNSKTEHNDVGVDQVQEVYTVTVKTPVATVTFSNASQYQKPILEQMRSSLGDEISALSHLDPSALIDLDVPVKVDDLLQLAKSSSPAKFREKIYGSQMMEKLIDTLQQKAVELYDLKNELDSEDAKHKIVKREAIWDASDMKVGTWGLTSVVQDGQWLPELNMQEGKWRTVPNMQNNQWWPAPNIPQRQWRTTSDMQNGQWWPIVAPIPATILDTSAIGMSRDVEARHVPIHHHLHRPHLLNHVHLPHHHVVPHLPHLHLLPLLPLLPLLRSEAIPLLRFPGALLKFILARPVQPPMPTIGSMIQPLPQPMDSGLRKLHRIQPQSQPYQSLSYFHGPESEPQPLPEKLPEVNSEDSEGDLVRQENAEVDHILTSFRKNPEFVNYKPISPWEGIFFSLFRGFSLT